MMKLSAYYLPIAPLLLHLLMICFGQGGLRSLSASNFKELEALSDCRPPWPKQIIMQIGKIKGRQIGKIK